MTALVDAEDDRRKGVSILPGGRRTLTLSQVADALQVDVRQVRKLIRSGSLRAVHVSERITRVTEAELGRWLLEHSRNRGI